MPKHSDGITSRARKYNLLLFPIESVANVAMKFARGLTDDWPNRKKHVKYVLPKLARWLWVDLVVVIVIRLRLFTAKSYVEAKFSHSIQSISAVVFIFRMNRFLSLGTIYLFNSWHCRHSAWYRNTLGRVSAMKCFSAAFCYIIICILWDIAESNVVINQVRSTFPRLKRFLLFFVFPFNSFNSSAIYYWRVCSRYAWVYTQNGNSFVNKQYLSDIFSG